MTTSNQSEITQVLQTISAGDRSAVDRLMPLVYDDFRSLARHFLGAERPGHTLQATELVNEPFLRLVDIKRVDWKGRSHFFAVGAQAMRRILVEHARAKLRKKRGERPHRVEMSEDLVLTPEKPEDLLAMDEALGKLAKLDERQARIVEMRFFGGLTIEEVAEVLGVSKRTGESEWTMIRAWLRRELTAAFPSKKSADSLLACRLDWGDDAGTPLDRRGSGASAAHRWRKNTIGPSSRRDPAGQA